MAAEYAFVTARPTRLISSIQVAITFAGLAIGAVGEPAVRSLVGGALLHAMGHLPDVGEVNSSHGFEFTVLEMDGSRIVRVRVGPIL